MCVIVNGLGPKKWYFLEVKGLEGNSEIELILFSSAEKKNLAK